MPELGKHDFPVRKPEPRVDPDHKHLAAAIKAVFEDLKPTDQERANFGARLAGELRGVG